MQQITAVLAAIGSAIVVMGGYHFFVIAPAFKRLAGGSETYAGSGTADANVPALAARLEALERTVRSELPRVGFVRYNAFADVGSDQSYALALLTRDGDGVVLSSIYSREETRTYGKAVDKFRTAQDASSEEKAAIARARAS